MGFVSACLSAPMPSDLQPALLPDHTIRCTEENCEDDREATCFKEIKEKEQDLQETSKEKGESLWTQMPESLLAVLQV